MKKVYTALLALCLIITSVPLTACATEHGIEDEISTEALLNSASAVIEDAEGNVIETLQVELVEYDSGDSEQRSSPTKSITLMARSSSPTSGESDPMDGVKAILTISWNDFLGTNNQLNSVSGSWSVGNETISQRFVRYSAQDVRGNTLQALTKNPTGNTFSYEPTDFTGYKFFLYSSATIDSTQNKLSFMINT